MIAIPDSPPPVNNVVERPKPCPLRKVNKSDSMPTDGAVDLPMPWPASTKSQNLAINKDQANDGSCMEEDIDPELEEYSHHSSEDGDLQELGKKLAWLIKVLLNEVYIYH